jgi:hypothetical protein
MRRMTRLGRSQPYDSRGVYENALVTYGGHFGRGLILHDVEQQARATRPLAQPPSSVLHQPASSDAAKFNSLIAAGRKHFCDSE